MGIKCGIVGLPNVGKSTLFNALTSTSAAEAANYPFCTIEPNIGIVSVPDERLTNLAKMAVSQKIIPTQIEFVDIAGLVKGASKGEGLGNQFLANIREVDAIIHMLRCFENSDITHVEGDVDPIRDIEIIETELIIADMESLDKRMPNLEKKAKTDKEAKEIFPVAQKLQAAFAEGLLGCKVKLNEEEKLLAKKLQLLTTKPILYVCNVNEEDAINGNAYTQKVIEYAKKEQAEAVIISAKIEEEIANLENDDEKKEFLETIGLSETGLSKLIRSAYKLLNLNTFFTIGPKEARAWTVHVGATAQEAAGVIHTDFAKGFIRAETISYADYKQYGNESAVKDAGKMRLEGKEYIVSDGDIFHFRFNV